MKVAIVENNDLYRDALQKRLVDKMEAIEMVGEAISVTTGLVLLQHIEPDVLLLDIEMKDGTGLDLVFQLEVTNFDVIFMSTHDERDFRVRKIKQAGFHFYNKGAHTSELITFIEACEYGLQTKASIESLRVLYHQRNSSNAVDNQQSKAKSKGWFPLFGKT